MAQIWQDADGSWARLDDGELCGPYRDRVELSPEARAADDSAAIADMIGPGRAPCCPWGSDPADWMPAAIALARIYAGQYGRAMPTQDECDSAASAIVNAGDDEAWELHDSYPEQVPGPRGYRPS